MSMVERILFWIGIAILVVALVGVKMNVSKLEHQLQQVSHETAEGGEE